MKILNLKILDEIYIYEALKNIFYYESHHTLPLTISPGYGKI